MKPLEGILVPQNLYSSESASHSIHSRTSSKPTCRRAPCLPLISAFVCFCFGCFLLHLPYRPSPPEADSFCAPQTAAKVTIKRSDERALMTGSSLLCLIIE